MIVNVHPLGRVDVLPKILTFLLRSGNNDIETFDCVPCGQGLTCPFSASISTLQSGESALGDEYVPKVLPGV